MIKAEIPQQEQWCSLHQSQQYLLQNQIMLKPRLLRVWAHSYSIAPETLSQIILIKPSYACLIVLKDTGCALVKNHCKMLITLDLLGTELYLYVQLVKIPFL